MKIVSVESTDWNHEFKCGTCGTVFVAEANAENTVDLRATDNWTGPFYVNCPTCTSRCMVKESNQIPFMLRKAVRKKAPVYRSSGWD